MVVVEFAAILISLKSVYNQVPSFAPSLKEQYFASIEESAIVGCLFELHVIGPFQVKTSSLKLTSFLQHPLPNWSLWIVEPH